MSESVAARAAARKEKVLVASQTALAALVDLKNSYYTADADAKAAKLQEASTAVTESLDSELAALPERERDSLAVRAESALVRGRALDAFETFNPEAEELLAKAVKLDSTNVDGWNALGECMWKKGDLVGARNCLESALRQGANKRSHIELSKLLRQIHGGSAEDRATLLQESVTHAKASVQLGFSDPEAWLGLGNAYVTVYFQATRVAADLDRALQAYARAEANGPEIPDVYYGRAQVLRFREDYQGAMANFRRAAELDPSLPGAQEADDIESWLVRVADLVARQGRIKQKRLKQLCAPLCSVKGVAEQGAEAVGVAELITGAAQNEGRAVALKPILPLGEASEVPARYICADRTGAFVVLSLYHLDAKRLSDKDICVVTGPDVVAVSWDQKAGEGGEASAGTGVDGAAADEAAVATAAAAASTDGGAAEAAPKFRSIQVRDPTRLLVNGKPLRAAVAGHLRISASSS
mmetsp:Transcript_101608/g.291235  ORF Transcript_101608/g.291235 Transcript_101608/m.291235 type:complete len:469 (+) Transcript_101608:86-1492(+)